MYGVGTGEWLAISMAFFNCMSTARFFGSMAYASDLTCAERSTNTKLRMNCLVDRDG
jgi:hypothetical protein